MSGIEKVAHKFNIPVELAEIILKSAEIGYDVGAKDALRGVLLGGMIAGVGITVNVIVRSYYKRKRDKKEAAR